MASTSTNGVGGSTTTTTTTTTNVGGGKKRGANAAAAAAAAAIVAGAGAGGGGASGGTAGANGGAPGAAAAGGGGKGNASHSRSYPRGVGVDFRKLAGLTLLNYIDHHGVPVRPEAPPSELAVAVARHFEQMEIDEEECIGGFLERLEQPVGITEYTLKTQNFDGHAPSLAVRKRKRNKWAARPGEQVAAKVTRTDENGSWILASVQRFYSDTETYDVQDEDDTSKLIRLPWTHVMRLSSGTEGVFSKGKDCMAIFPETTSFYRAKVSKVPVWKMDKGGIPMVKEIIVKFEDDEDPQGRTPHRRVPARYVIPVPSDYFYEEMEDVDLSLAAAAAAAAAATNPAAVPSAATAAAANTSATGAASSTGSSSSPILTTTASATMAVK